MIIDLEKYILDVDIEATKQAYTKIQPVNEQCACDDCQNYAIAIKTVNLKITEFFDSFGINISRPAEVWGWYDKEKNIYDYGGFYHIVGNIIEQKEKLDIQFMKKLSHMNGNMVIQLTDKFHIWFTNDCALIPDDFPKPYFQMEISTELPWSLNRPCAEDIEDKPKGNYNNKEYDVTLIEKKIRKTIFGKKYTFYFTSEKKHFKMNVYKEAFEFYKIGWETKIIYIAGRLIIY
ncbi:MAG: hypothetical protein AAGU14_08750 [Eubacteriaceae bacterium]